MRQQWFHTPTSATVQVNFFSISGGDVCYKGSAYTNVIVGLTDARPQVSNLPVKHYITFRRTLSWRQKNYSNRTWYAVA